jgi:hypothetical protein
MPFSSTIIKDLQQTEYRLEIYLDWLRCLNLEAQDQNDFIEKQFTIFLEAHNKLYQHIPDHEILHPIHEFTQKLPNSWLSVKQKTEIPDIDNSHWILNTSAKANKLRVDTSVSLSLVRHFLQTSSLGTKDAFILNTTAQTLTTLGVAIPFFNLLLITYDFLSKLREDLKNDSITKKHNWHLFLKQYQLLKNILLIILNITSFLVSFYNLFPMHFYFSFASIALDHIFYVIDYVKNNEFLVKQENEFIQGLSEKNPNLNKQDLKNKKDFYQALIKALNEPIDEELKFLMMQILLTHQKQKINTDKFIFECVSFVLMLATMIVMQTTGIFPTQQLLLIGLLSSYFYNVLKPYLTHLFIELMNTETIQFSGPNKEQISLHQGKSTKTSSLSSYTLEPQLLLALLGKIVIPLTLISILPALAPLHIILILSASHLLVNILEDLFKSNAKVGNEPKIEPQPESASLILKPSSSTI